MEKQHCDGELWSIFNGGHKAWLTENFSAHSNGRNDNEH